MKLHEIVTEAYYDSYSGRNYRGNGTFGGRSYSERLRDEAADLGDETDPVIGSRTQWARRPRPQQTRSATPQATDRFCIEVNGKVWKKDGRTRVFTASSINNIVKTLRARLPGKKVEARPYESAPGTV